MPRQRRMLGREVERAIERVQARRQPTRPIPEMIEILNATTDEIETLNREIANATTYYAGQWPTSSGADFTSSFTSAPIRVWPPPVSDADRALEQTLDNAERLLDEIRYSDPNEVLDEDYVSDPDYPAEYDEDLPRPGEPYEITPPPTPLVCHYCGADVAAEERCSCKSTEYFGRRLLFKVKETPTLI